MEQDIAVELIGLTKSFPGVRALNGVSLAVRKGEVHALVGENGAGKSTLLKILSGAVIPDSGHIRKNGKEIKITSPTEAHRLGISLVYQELQQVPELSVAQNIFLAREPTYLSGLIVDKRESEREALALLKYIGVDLDVRVPIKSLGIADRQMIEIAKALLGQSDVIAFDEPTSSISKIETDNLFKVIRELRDRGVGIIYVSHRLNEIGEIADRVTILRDGELVISGLISEFSQKDIVKYMVGRDLDKTETALKAQIDRTSDATNDDNASGMGVARHEVIRVESLGNAKVKDISFSLFEGEILGIAGLVGSGRTEMVRAIYGADPATGEVFLEGKKVSIKSPKEAIALGIGLIPEDRKGQAILRMMPVRINIILASLKMAEVFGVISKRRMIEAVSPIIESLNIRASSLERPIVNLSGGNQQKAVVGRSLLAQSKILIFDEPTRGIDVGAKVEIYRLMRELVAKGKSIIMVSSELPEILLMSDRVLVMKEGRIVTELSREQATEQSIMLSATGGK
jgi:ribose transport system ATP-binding protein